MEVRFDWDPAKSDRNLEERGWEDNRRDYGEIRHIAFGRIEGRWVTVVYTDRTRVNNWIVRRIISARESSRRERQAYLEAIAKS